MHCLVDIMMEVMEEVPLCFWIFKNKLIVFIVLVFGIHVSHRVIANSCNNNVTASRYKRYPLSFDGCREVQNTHGAARGATWCATMCQLTCECVGFRYSDNNTACYSCEGEQLGGLSFQGEFLFLSRSQIFIDVPFISPGYTEMAVIVPEGLKNSTVVFLSSVILLDTRFDLTFHRGDSDVAFQFSPNIDFGGYKNVVILTHQLSNVWANDTIYKHPSPLLVNVQTDVFVLVTSDAFLVYINGVYCCQYEHVLPVKEISSIAVSGPIKVLEISY